MRKLNGWQRLWVVLSAIYLLAVGIVTTLVFMPKEELIKRAWAYDLIDVVRDHDTSLRSKTTGGILNQYSDLSYDEIISRVQKKHSKPNMIAEYTVINKKYEDRLANLGKEKIKGVSIGFLFWLVPVILVYVLGLAAGWIYRGFRQT